MSGFTAPPRRTLEELPVLYEGIRENTGSKTKKTKDCCV